MSAIELVARRHPTSRVAAGAALVALSPVLGLACALIKLSSRGPVLFLAARAGQAGRPFAMVKLRTMHRDLEGDIKRITGGRDARVFPVGRWLRRLKIDELPQLTNVVLGDMVLVGPRPEDPTIVRDHYTPLMLETLSVPPGLTSPGTLDYFAAEARMPEDPVEAERVYLSELLPRKIALDLMYVRNQSWRYDAELVLRTAASVAGIRGLFPRRRAWEVAGAYELLSTVQPGEPPAEPERQR